MVVEQLNANAYSAYCVMVSRWTSSKPVTAVIACAAVWPAASPRTIRAGRAMRRRADTGTDKASRAFDAAMQWNAPALALAARLSARPRSTDSSLRSEVRAETIGITPGTNLNVRDFRTSPWPFRLFTW